MSTHTPTPWVYDIRKRSDRDGDVYVLQHTTCFWQLDDAERFRQELQERERLMDSHDALLAACKEAEPVFADAVSACIAARIPGWQKLSGVRDKLCDAIKLAEGQG